MSFTDEQKELIRGLDSVTLFRFLVSRANMRYIDSGKHVVLWFDWEEWKELAENAHMEATVK